MTRYFKPASVILFISVTIILSACADNKAPEPKEQAPVEHPDSNANKAVVTYERIDPAINSIIGENPRSETLAEGFEWSEGPLWLEKEKTLIFSDVPTNTIYKWTAGKGKEVYLTPSGYTGTIKRGGETGSNGLTLNDKGQLTLCQHGDRKIAVMDAPLSAPEAKFITIADHYNGKKFDSPNDVICTKNGDYYFTDPPYGLVNNAADSSKEAPYQGVYRISGGKVTLLTDTIKRPNGIAEFPDGHSMVVASSDPEKAVWYRYDVDAKGGFSNGRLFYDATENARNEKGLPDGLKIDRNGNVFASGPGGVWIFDKEAKLLGKIKVNQAVSNCALADDDKTIYITADNFVVRVNLR